MVLSKIYLLVNDSALKRVSKTTGGSTGLSTSPASFSSLSSGIALTDFNRKQLLPPAFDGIVVFISKYLLTKNCKRIKILSDRTQFDCFLTSSLDLIILML